MDTRRDFIKKAALLSGAAGLYGVLPASIQKALAIEARLGSTYLDAEHIVILMQENRSFDHCFGTLRGVRGFNDPRAIDLPDQNRVWLQSNAAGETYTPFRLNIKDTQATWMGDLPHSWENQVDARNNGKYDNWLTAKRTGNKSNPNMPLTLGYYNREDIPFYYALADAFTVCDQHFCSSLTGTSPNRLFLWSGTIREEQNENSKAHVSNGEIDYKDLRWKTFPERLEEQGISWKTYQNELSIPVGFEGEEEGWLANFTDNDLEFFAQYNVRLHDKHLQYLPKKVVLLTNTIKELTEKLQKDPADEKIEKELKKRQKELILTRQEQEKWTQERFDKLSEHEKSIHRRAFVTNVKDPDYHQLATLSYDDNGTPREVKVPKGDVLHQFREDVKTGNLPTVSWLVAPSNFSDHPGAPWYGAWYVSEAMDILTQDPEVWKKTIFILTYDENDGYFDHVPPFVPPHSEKPETGLASKGLDTRVEHVSIQNKANIKYERDSPIGLGFRVPMVIASPWSRGGWVNSQVFDHTSCLQFLEDFLGKKTGKNIRETNISDWRRTVCGNLTSVFRPYNNERLATPESLKQNAVVEGIHKAKFKKLPDGFKLLNQNEIDQINQDPLASPYMPKQEEGVRTSCALPYQLYAEGKLSADKKTLQIGFAAKDDVFGRKAAGTSFNVYAPGKYLQKTEDNPGAFENGRNWAYSVKAGDSLTGEWPLSEFENHEYHLRLYGPNGFFREFKGDGQDPEIDISCEYQHVAGDRKKLTGNIELKLANLNKGQKYTVEVTDHAYKTRHDKKVLAAKGVLPVILNLENSFGWYDFSIKVTGNKSFEKRYAGRVETGKHGYSDPFMGRAV